MKPVSLTTDDPIVESCARRLCAATGIPPETVTIEGPQAWTFCVAAAQEIVAAVRAEVRKS